MRDNPYQAPESPSRDPVKTSTEQRLAQHFLAQRDGYSIAYVLRKSARGFMLLACMLVLVIIGFCSVDDSFAKGGFLVCIGLFVGAILRDLGWLRRIKRQWPFTRKVIDWRKVEAYAEGWTPAEDSEDFA